MINRMVSKILIVGGGVTGAVVSSLLRENFGKCISISVWDSGRDAGGRMSTSRSTVDEKCTVDLGAQYISALPEYNKTHVQYYLELLEANILQPLSGEIHGHQDRQPGINHYVTPAGVSSLVQFYLNKSGAIFEAEQTVTDVSVQPPDKVKVTTDKGMAETFDAVVITIPAPQVLQLGSRLQTLIAGHDGLYEKLAAVSYSSRFAVGLFYPPGTTFSYPWSATYVTDDPCIRFVSIDTRKRGQEDASTGPSICVHTGVPWGLANVERGQDDVIGDILHHLKIVLPDLPEPVEVIGHKWRYSQVYKGFEGCPACVVLRETPAVVLAGDAFTQSTFDGCLQSAIAITDIFRKLYLNSSYDGS